MMASNFFDSARVRAAEGTSHAPGTRTISISFFAAPLRWRASSEPWRRRAGMTVFQRVVTRARRRLAALGSPWGALGWLWGGFWDGHRPSFISGVSWTVKKRV